MEKKVSQLPVGLVKERVVSKMREGGGAEVGGGGGMWGRGEQLAAYVCNWRQYSHLQSRD